MTSLERYIANLKSLRDGKLKDLYVDTLKENLPELEDAQIDQMRLGMNADGVEIGRYRNPSYAEFKKSIGSKSKIGVVDLRVTGDFQSAIFGEVSKTSIEFDSRDSKTGKLVLKYGDEIFGLNENTLEEQNNDLIFPVLKDKIIDYVIK